MSKHFSYKSFFGSYGIEYVDQGPNVAKGDINIKCPFCLDDPSHHLGINPQTGFWCCWRNKAHSGRRPLRLVMRLLRCSYQQARKIVGESSPTFSTSVDIFSQPASELFSSEAKLEGVENLSLPPEVRPLWESKGPPALRYWHYLAQDRGFFDDEHLSSMAHSYNLHYALTGEWKQRIILPLVYEDKLMTWTGRTIGLHTEPRYKTLTTSKSVRSLKQLIWPFDVVDWGDVLVVVEGPFDAMKVDWYGKSSGVRSVCLFGREASKNQIQLIWRRAWMSFKKVVVLLDEGNLHGALDLMDQLAFLDPVLEVLPDGIKDPGDLTPQQVWELARKLNP